MALQTSTSKAGSYGLHDTMRSGPGHALNNVVASHPLENSEKTYLQKNEVRELAASRKMQGMHMSMKLQMERTVASKIHRLPGLPSSNLALRTLMDNDMVGPEDIFNGMKPIIYTVKALISKYLRQSSVIPETMVDYQL